MTDFISAVRLPDSDTPVGFAVLTGDGSVLQPRTTEGIYEIETPEESKIYVTQVVTDDLADPRSVCWDNGGDCVIRPVHDVTPVRLGTCISTVRLPKGAQAGYTLYNGYGEVVAVRSTGEIALIYDEAPDYDLYQAIVSPPVGVPTGLILWDSGEGQNPVFEIWAPGVTVPDEGSDSGSDSGPVEPTVTSVLLRFCVAQFGATQLLNPVPVFASPSGGYGVVDLDDDEEIILSPGTALSPLGNNVYGREFEIPVENADHHLRYYVKTVIGETVYYVPATTHLVWSAMLAIGRYTDSTEIAMAYGHDNMHLWLSLPGGETDEPVDYALRAWKFIDQAEQRINNKIAGAYVEVPIVLETGDEYSDIIKECATLLAGVLMYEARGILDVNPVTGETNHRLQFQKNYVNDQLNRVVVGRLKITGNESPRVIPTFYTGDASLRANRNC